VSVTVTLLGDTMLGRGVAEAIGSAGPRSLVAPEVVELARADLVVLNLECCISSRGERWPDPDKPFFFRAPPEAVDVLLGLGVDCVTLANNHALDYGTDALLDTLALLDGAGIATVGAGPDVDAARRPAVLEARGVRLAVLGLTDHPRDFAATDHGAGVAYADLRSGVPGWVTDAIGTARAGADAVLVTPHWGPNMVSSPVPHVRAAAAALTAAGATVVAGHSAHVPHGLAGPVLYDLGDFLDDYAVDPVLRNDLGLLWRVTLDERGPQRVEAYPIALDFCHTRRADPEEAAWMARRFTQACRGLGTEVREASESSALVV
jgi:poly-gamma-glutamate capsule biosynthesis protein CapA/YwtB (metallophosphatase superfamily)